MLDNRLQFLNEIIQQKTNYFWFEIQRVKSNEKKKNLRLIKITFSVCEPVLKPNGFPKKQAIHNLIEKVQVTISYFII